MRCRLLWACLASACTFGSGGGIGPGASTADGDAGTTAVLPGTRDDGGDDAPSTSDTRPGSDDTTAADSNVDSTTMSGPGPTSAGTDATDSSTGSMPPEGLINEGLVARYFLDEGARGVPPDGAPVLDYGPGSKLDLVVTSQSNQPFYVQDNDNRGLGWSSTNNQGVPVIPVGGTKVGDLDMDTDLTIEFVARVQGVNSGGTRFVHVGLNGVDSFAVSSRALNRLEFRTSTSFEQAIFDVQLEDTRTVYAVVVDFTDETPYRLYVDGEPQTLLSVDPESSPTMLVVDPAHMFSLGNRDDGMRSLQGALFYAAIYRRALTQAELKHNAMLLGVHDDAP